MENDCFIIKDNCYFRYRTGAIILRGRKMLFVQNDLSDYYYMIGGAVEIGETSQECIEREVLARRSAARSSARISSAGTASTRGSAANSATSSNSIT